MAAAPSGAEPEGFAGPNDHWHFHSGICLVAGPTGSQEALGFDGSITQRQCGERKGRWVANSGYLLHVWTVPSYTDPLGVFAHMNPLLTCGDGDVLHRRSGHHESVQAAVIRQVRGVVLLGGALLTAAIAACARVVTRQLVRPEQAATLDHKSPFLKAHLRSGYVYVLQEWSWSDSSGTVSGFGTLYDTDRHPVGPAARVTLPRDSAALFETNVSHLSGSAVALTVMAGVTAAVAIGCAFNPKACFGSCPTFYAPDSSGRSVLQAEGFSASIAPALEASISMRFTAREPRGAGIFRCGSRTKRSRRTSFATPISLSRRGRRMAASSRRRAASFDPPRRSLRRQLQRARRRLPRRAGRVRRTRAVHCRRLERPRRPRDDRPRVHARASRSPRRRRHGAPVAHDHIPHISGARVHGE